MKKSRYAVSFGIIFLIRSYDESPTESSSLVTIPYINY